MSMSSVREAVDAELGGRARTYDYYKNVASLIGASVYYDMSMSSGNPRPKYWFDAPPTIAKAVYQSEDGGIFHGSNVTPYTKYLRYISAQAIGAATVPMSATLCDYLLYYPSLDESFVGEQLLDNTVTLPRFSDGAGVQMLPIIVAQGVGGATFTVTYTNSDGVAGRTSRIMTTTSSGNGSSVGSTPTIVNATDPFISLQEGDTGVRSVEALNMLTADVGLVSIVLVKPLAQIGLKEAAAPHEKDLLINGGGLPIIEDDAYLNFVTVFGTASPGGFRGDIKVIWN